MAESIPIAAVAVAGLLGVIGFAWAALKATRAEANQRARADQAGRVAVEIAAESERMGLLYDQEHARANRLADELAALEDAVVAGADADGLAALSSRSGVRRDDDHHPDSDDSDPVPGGGDEGPIDGDLSG